MYLQMYTATYYTVYIHPKNQFTNSDVLQPSIQQVYSAHTNNTKNLVQFYLLAVTLYFVSVCECRYIHLYYSVNGEQSL